MTQEECSTLLMTAGALQDISEQAEGNISSQIKEVQWILEKVIKNSDYYTEHIEIKIPSYASKKTKSIC